MADNNISLCWIDIETTGLDANFDVPLEVGIKLTDKEGFVYAARRWLVNEESERYQVAIEAGKADAFVGPMHEKSGLWDELDDDEFRGQPRSEVDEELCEVLDEYEVPYGSIGLIGSSIGSLDRPFVLAHFPKFNLQVGYRNLDVSTIKELCKRHNPALYQNLLPIIGDKSMAPHRVFGDIDASIVEYRAYLDNFLICED